MNVMSRLEGSQIPYLQEAALEEKQIAEELEKETEADTAVDEVESVYSSDEDSLGQNGVHRKIKYSNGRVEEGYFFGNHLKKGKIETAEGVSYQGVYMNGKLHGKGSVLYSLSDCGWIEHSGEYRMGKFVYGKIVSFFLPKNCNPLSSLMQGPFFNGKLDHYQKEKELGDLLKPGEEVIEGDGLYIRTDGKVFKGQFLEGKLHGRGRTIYPSGTIYEGNYSQGGLYERARISYEQGAVFEGYIHAIAWPIMDTFTGHINGLKGEGELTVQYEKSYKGVFENGFFSGKIKKDKKTRSGFCFIETINVIGHRLLLETESDVGF